MQLDIFWTAIPFLKVNINIVFNYYEDNGLAVQHISNLCFSNFAQRCQATLSQN